MITVIRTATAFPGMTGEALSWAKEIAAPSVCRRTWTRRDSQAGVGFPASTQAFFIVSFAEPSIS